MLINKIFNKSNVNFKGQTIITGYDSCDSYRPLFVDDIVSILTGLDKANIGATFAFNNGQGYDKKITPPKEDDSFYNAIASCIKNLRLPEKAYLKVITPEKEGDEKPPKTIIKTEALNAISKGNFDIFI